jgi:predicted MFS family arabinose efflux permease
VSSLAADASPQGPHGGVGSPRLWQNLWVRLAVALAFADASIVVLALPQIVDRLHTPIAHVTWVIMAYNLALVVTSVLVVAFGGRLPSTPTLVIGLGVFGVASIGCGAASSLAALIPLRCVQGVGGALVLAASLPLFAAATRPGDSPLNGWSAAAAIGAAVGPAMGGILTQLFDWRSIFYAQAPVAAFAAVAVLVVSRGAAPAAEIEIDRPPSRLDPLTANVALALLSAAIIGALFLVVIELINAWLLTPIAAAAVVSTIPLATAAAERLVRGRSAILLGAAGALMLALGLILLALLHHRQLGVVVVALALCGGGLGLAFPGLTAVALESPGSAMARAAKTVAARDAGLVLGLLILTPVFAHQITKVANDKGPVAAVTGIVLRAPLSLGTKIQLGVGLLGAYKSAGQADVPKVDPVFTHLSAGQTPSTRAALLTLRRQVDAIVQRAVTPAFRRPLGYAAGLALLVLPLLGLRLLFLRRRGAGPPAGAV